ncbi:MAG: ABC transporter ATP-binding protein [Leptospira sp.]|nr:ABC transporter ATP-binding protein [Leptospira sp.]
MTENSIETSELALQISDLTKTYANGFQALKNINLEVKKGDFFALLGPNGAGKSTTIGIISSLINKTSGKIKIFGVDSDLDPNKAKSLIGIVPQEFNFGIFETLRRILCNQAGYYGIPRNIAKDRADHYLELLGLYEKRNEQAMKLSGGMKRRLMIARALIHEPQLLILDEPTAGVDIELRRSMWDFLTTLNQNGTTIILTTHYLEEAESLCKNIAIIDKGLIVTNTSIKKLLATLDSETFILDLKSNVESIPDCPGIQIKIIDEKTIEATINKSVAINDLYSLFNSCGVQVSSMRNKTNRLEELFLNLVEKTLK